MSQETLLVVEDHLILREGLSEMLGLEGYTVHTASNGRDALRKMEHMTPDLILSDIGMPEMDGYEFFKVVRQKPEWFAIPFLFLTARGEREDVLLGKDLGAEDYLIKPVTHEELVTAVRARMARSRQLHMAQIQQAYESSLTVLASGIEVRDQYTRGHVERVKNYAVAIAQEMGLRGKRLEEIRFGAILHDIGKIHISEATLSQKEPLSEAQWAEIRRHPETGGEMIKDIPFLASAIQVVKCHHENWDGSGYPKGLCGEEIPLSARITALADGYDAMTTERPYRRVMSRAEAVADLQAKAGSKYDPQVVEAFLRVLEKEPV